MELKQDDRNLLREFFGNQSDWMGNNSLRVLENLVELKRKFDEFVKSKKCEDNLACKIFVLTLEHEVLKCKERQLIQLYNKDINKNKNRLILFLIIIFLPIILFIMCLTREIYLIRNSSIIVFYDPGSLDSLGETDFAYAISDKYFEEISTEMDLIEYAKTNTLNLIKEIMQNIGK